MIGLDCIFNNAFGILSVRSPILELIPPHKTIDDLTFLFFIINLSNSLNFSVHDVNIVFTIHSKSIIFTPRLSLYSDFYF